MNQSWEEELFRLASLVGTDAKNPKERLLAYVSQQITLAEKRGFEKGAEEGVKITMKAVDLLEQGKTIQEIKQLTIDAIKAEIEKL